MPGVSRDGVAPCWHGWGRVVPQDGRLIPLFVFDKMLCLGVGDQLSEMLPKTTFVHIFQGRFANAFVHSASR